MLAAVAIIFATPASGGMASRFATAVGFGPSPSQNGASFGGTAAVGALFTTSDGHLGTHFCTASVVNSPHGNLLLTAAHCVVGTQGTPVEIMGRLIHHSFFPELWDVRNELTRMNLPE